MLKKVFSLMCGCVMVLLPSCGSKAVVQTEPSNPKVETLKELQSLGYTDSDARVKEETKKELQSLGYMDKETEKELNSLGYLK